MKQRITIIACYYGHKLGVGVFMERLLPLLIEKILGKDYRITLIVSNDFYNNSVHLLPQNKDLAIVKPILLRKSIFSKFYFLFILPFLPYVKRAKYVLYCSDAIVGKSVKNSIPIIHDLNDFEEENKFGFLRTLFRKKMIELSLKRACKVVVISKFVKAQIEKAFPKEVDNKSVKVIYNGITLCHEVILSSNEKDSDSNEVYFLIVGRLDPYAKKLYEAVTLFQTYKKLHSSIKLKFVGGINDYCKEDAEIFLQYITNDKDISYLGFVSDEELDVLYKNALATIFLSKYEGFGFPLLESFARGCPVITNAENEVNDELSSGKDIKILESELSNEAIVDNKISQIYNVDRNELIKIAGNFTWERAANDYLGELMKN
ncbi:glycosyltransferase family 4 protein [Dysgonomonas sp. HDW5B]|uniref:glycosyltransferase n=1 Tax=Dysgonomonas sp. HDW5B TaxID=2714927 RepID=UPI0014089845|nr:glycosyltransferase [Dysgonomonas sp. HDW5B]QIK54769.1 glycosyltransferase family 4 protein [Dysgonomonas sp. HDW5B]